MPQYDTAIRNARQNAIETTVGVSPILRLRTGAPPANPAAADTGTVLATLNLPSDWLTASASGVVSKNGTWQDASADASGMAQHYRIYDSGGSTCRLQGLISQPHAVSTAVVLNQQMHNAGNVYRCTTAGTTGAASPPTGTGTGIADGTVVWNYVGKLDMALDNTNIAVTQQVTVNQYDLTEGNA
jgi:hypothetical protein